MLKTSKKPKKKSSKTLRAKCLEAAQKLARISAANEHGMVECVSCGIWGHYKEFHGGHFLAKGSCRRWALRLENIHPQCHGCNMFGMSHKTAAPSYTLWMIDWYGRDFVDNMISTKNEPIKLYKKDYEEMLKDFNEQIKFHERRICG